MADPTVSPHHAELVNADGSWKYTNALIDETSPYLRQHAHNPVDWKPWGPAAFAEAARRDVPIFLSIGYSTCYWCHVMERQVFENPKIGEQMNAQFVCIKVDREERPDVDDIYMTATQLLTGSGGWPMSVFLTPPAPGSLAGDGDAVEKTATAPAPGSFPGSSSESPSEVSGDGGSGGKELSGAAKRGVEGSGGRGLLPFWAGTYIPPELAYGRPGFPQVMDAMSQAWIEQRTQVLEQSERVADAVRQQVAASGSPGNAPGNAPENATENAPKNASEGVFGDASGGAMARRVVGQLQQRYDSTHGGFSGNEGPKFPTPSTVALLLEVYGQQPDERLGQQIQHTLGRMARGGMYDQVGGGFHRYSTDEKWLVPHFEKMLYDNGQLLELYAQAYTTWEDQPEAALYARVMRETAEYLLREMLDGSALGGGGFWSAQDAEVNTKEGENYVWTAAQVREALAGEPDGEALTALAMKMYGLDRGTNFQDPHHSELPAVNVLYLPEPMAELVGFAGGAVEGLMRMRRRINAALLEVRDARDQPGTDDKVLVAWNGLAIAGLAEAGRVLDEPRYVRAAQRAADTILKHMSSEDGGLRRSMRQGEAKISAFLEDYAFFVHGLLALHRALPADGEGGSGEGGRYREEAQRLMAYAYEHFAAPNGGYYDTLADQSDLFVRTRSTYDGALPSGNSQMVHNGVDLLVATGDEALIRRAVDDLRSFSEAMDQSGLGMTHMVRGLLRFDASAPREWAALLVANETQGGGDAGGPVTAKVSPIEGQAGAYRVELLIAEGFHLNANPVSSEGLIPTALSAGGVALEVVYPEGTARRYPFAEEAVRVYEGRVGLVVRAASPIADLTLTYQACTERACLAPATLRVELPTPR